MEGASLVGCKIRHFSPSRSRAFRKPWRADRRWIESGLSIDRVSVAEGEVGNP